MTPSTPCCPAFPSPGCGGARRGDTVALMPRDGPERAVMLALRFVAAAGDTGDAACWDAAFDRAEAEFGPRDGALLVARAAALLRTLGREEAAVPFMPPPCRRLSAGEALLLDAVREGLAGARHPAGRHHSPALAAALADLVAPLRSSPPGLALVVRPEWLSPPFGSLGPPTERGCTEPSLTQGGASV